jgi:hypothetical protein
VILFEQIESVGAPLPRQTLGNGGRRPAKGVADRFGSGVEPRVCWRSRRALVVRAGADAGRFSPCG